jgi:ribosome biogenesis SPOUT family RNA methylase Rps3
MKYIIEHMEKRLYKWCFLEYEHISRIVGKENLVFTNLNKNQAEKLSLFGERHTKSISRLRFEKMCVLDPEAGKTLTSKDTKSFDCLVFGGILGDNPPRKRTGEELVLEGVERRNIGKEQFPTDNAVYVCKEIIGGKKMQELKFRDEVEIDIAPGESVILPFRYVLVGGKPLISEELLKYIKTHKGF